jgi:hypothetical protein
LTEADIVVAHHKAALMEFLKNPPSHLSETEFIDILLASGLTSDDIATAKRNWDRKKRQAIDDTPNIFDSDSIGTPAECTVLTNNNDNIFRTSNSSTGYIGTDSYDDEDEIKENDKELKSITSIHDKNTNSDNNEDPDNEHGVMLALKESLTLKQERPLDCHAHLFTKPYDDESDDEEIKVDDELKSIFDTRRKTNNKNNTAVTEDRQKRIEKIKEDVDRTVVSFSKAISKVNDDNSNAKTISNTSEYICCQRCTYHNSKTAVECNMCGMTFSNTKINNSKVDTNTYKPSSAVAVAAQLPPTCVVESILRDDDDDGNIRGLDSAVVDFPIRCPVCTLDNHPGTANCEACGSKLSIATTDDYQTVTNHNSNTNTSSTKKSKKRNSNSNSSSRSNNDYIPEAVVIPMSSNSVYQVEAFPIDDNR